ncbi:MAG TPA: PIN domain-containing protein [Verrucomicrobiae bacterium]|nr:PIN domain-containing protein [Verrucomicrobiae bacterium]
MSPYADTNFYTRVYLEQPESAEADRLLVIAKEGSAAPLPITWLHRIETLNAFQLQVFVSRSSNQIFTSPEQAALAHANFRSDVQNAAFLRNVALMQSEIEKQVEELALRHTARHGFRVYDLLHVSSALLLKCDAFWTFDSKAAKLAELEGLRSR